MGQVQIAVMLAATLVEGRAPAQALPQMASALPAAPPAQAVSLERRPATLEAPRNLPPGAPRAQGPLSLVVLLDTRLEPSEPGVRRIDFREEATAPAYFTQYDGGSLLASVRARCATGEFQLESFHLYSRNNLSGDLVATIDRRSEWRTPAQDTVVQKALELGCGRTLQRPTQVAARAAPAAQTPASGATGAALRGPVGPSAPAAAPAARPAPPAPSAPRPPEGPARFAGALQVGAVPVEADAREILAKLRRAEPARLANLAGSVSRIEVEGRTMYRALLTGFAARSDAVRLCSELSARGQRCFVRD